MKYLPDPVASVTQGPLLLAAPMSVSLLPVSQPIQTEDETFAEIPVSVVYSLSGVPEVVEADVDGLGFGVFDAGKG